MTMKVEAFREALENMRNMIDGAMAYGCLADWDVQAALVVMLQRDLHDLEKKLTEDGNGRVPEQ